MRRWNGWGDEAVALDLPPEGDDFLRQRIGQGTPLPDADLASVWSGSAIGLR